MFTKIYDFVGLCFLVMTLHDLLQQPQRNALLITHPATFWKHET